VSNALGNVELVAAIEAVAARDNQFTRRALFETLRRAELVLAGDCAGLALNPAGPIGGILTRDDVSSLVEAPP